MPHDLDPTILSSEPVYDLGGTVRGSVIGDQELEVGEGLVEYAANASLQKRLPVVDGEHNANGGACHTSGRTELKEA